MSTLENVIWHVLGYSAMPVIFLIGFFAVAGGAVTLLAFTADKKQDQCIEWVCEMQIINANR